MKVKTNIGDIFLVELNNTKRYFQLIAFDLLQLNSDVIRVFKKNYSIDEQPSLTDIIIDEVDFYVHCVTDLGKKMKLWKKIGNLDDVGNLSHILFKDTNDYGHGPEEKSIKISHNWYIWKIGDNDFSWVGELKGKHQKAYIGIVINPLGIIEMLKGNKYPPLYPD
jgi:hypothetical protein